MKASPSGKNGSSSTGSGSGKGNATNNIVERRSELIIKIMNS